MSGFTEEQPKDGDTVVYCGHMGAPKCHFFKFVGNGVPFTRPDSTQGLAHWLITCDTCFNIAQGNPDMITIHGDAIWRGNDPIIRPAGN